MQLPYLGHRMVDAHGKPGAYSWQSYRDVGEVRSAIGSGLIAHGVNPDSYVGLYRWGLRQAGCLPCWEGGRGAAL